MSGTVDLTGKIKQKTVNPTNPGFFLVDAGDVEGGLGVFVNSILDRDAIPLYQRDNSRVVHVKDVGIYVYTGAALNTGWDSIGNWVEIGANPEIPPTNITHNTSLTTVTINSSTGGGTTIAASDATKAGVMTKDNYNKLAAIESEAEKNNKTTLINTPTSNSIVMEARGYDAADVAIPGDATSIPLVDKNNDKAGLISATDKIKLDGIANGAEVNLVTSVATRTGDVVIDITDVTNGIHDNQIGANGGIAPLDGSGKVPAIHLNLSSTTYLGTWTATTNSPTLSDATGVSAGDAYAVVDTFTRDLGSGSVSFIAGDFVIFNGTIWERTPTASGVTAVNGLTGTVVLDKRSFTGTYGLNEVENIPDLDKVVSNLTEARIVGVEAVAAAHKNEDIHLIPDERDGLSAAPTPATSANAIVTKDDLEIRLNGVDVGDMKESDYATNNIAGHYVDNAEHADEASNALLLDNASKTDLDQRPHVANDSVHLDDNERAAIDNSPSVPTSSNPFATIQDITDSGIADLLSSRITQDITPTQDIFGWKKGVTFNGPVGETLGATLEEILRKIALEYLSPEFSAFTISNIEYDGVAGSFTSEVENGTLVDFDGISVGWDVDSSGDPFSDVRFTGIKNTDALISASPTGSGLTATLSIAENNILYAASAGQGYTFTVTGKDSENKAKAINLTITSKFARFFILSSSDVMTSEIARGVGSTKTLGVSRGATYGPVTAGSTQYVWAVYPTSWGAGSFYDYSAPLAMEDPDIFELTMANGSPVEYYAYRTTHPGTDNLIMVIV